MRRTRIALSIVAVLGLTAVGANAAHADPPSVPPVTAMVVVGDQTSQYVTDALASAYDATNPANPVYGWDSTTTGQPQPIQSKTEAPPPAYQYCDLTRPNGSSPAVLGLLSSRPNLVNVPGEPYDYACVDAVRSSRMLTSTDPSWLTSVGYGVDAVTWSAVGGGNAVANLTHQELKAIYLCDASQLPTGDVQHAGPVKWSDLKLEGGTSTDQIVPVLPQADAGTRAQWLVDLGLSNIDFNQYPYYLCVNNGTFSNTSIQEDEGTNPVFTAPGWFGSGNPNGYKDVLFPYSGGVYICQTYTGNCGKQASNEGNLTLRQIDGKNPLNTATNPPTLNLVPGLNNPGFPALYFRTLAYIVRNGGSQSAPLVATPTTAGAQWPIDMTPFLGQNNAHGWICSAAAQNIIKSFGFLTRPNCGLLLNSTATPAPAPPTP